MGTVFWDLDGTLIDPKAGITSSVQAALRAIGITPPPTDELEWTIGPALISSFEKLGAPDPEAALTEYRRVYTSGEMYKCSIYPGIPEALADIDTRHRMHIATAKPHAYAQKLTAALGLADHMDCEFGPELDGTRNDKGELLTFAMAQTGDDPAHSVMIGDRQYDMKAARNVGMKFIAVDWGYGKNDDLSGADVVVKTPSELPGVVDRLLNGA